MSDATITANDNTTNEDQALIFEIIEDIEGRLQGHYHPGFGISPSAHPKDNYSNQVWARDFAHAAGNYFADVRPEAVTHSLETLFRYQRADGMLPYRIEREYAFLKFFPGFRHFSKSAFTLIEKKLRGRDERPVYENQDFGGGEDTVPVVLIAVGAFYHAGPEGKAFAQNHYDQLCRAAAFFETKCDSSDALAVIKNDNADWADTIRRTGKLGAINVWWAQALFVMADIARELGHAADASEYQKKYERVRESVMTSLYAPEGYFKAEVYDDRLDTVASIFGALYLLSAHEAARVEATLKKRVTRPNGLLNFDPPYPREQIFWSHRLIFRDGEYHNHFVWPWVTLQNIYVKIKIAREHPDAPIRTEFQHEAVADFIAMSKIFKAVGGAPEILHAHNQGLPEAKRYKIPAHFMGSLAGYAGIYRRLKQLGWL